MKYEDTDYLEKARADAIAREAARDRMTVAQWDQGMQRIFKGIMSRPERHSMLRAAQARFDRTGSFERPTLRKRHRDKA